jgi:spoIIIJ-associated protein
MALTEIQQDPNPETSADVGKKAQDFLAAVLQRMDIRAEISVTELEDKIVLDIDCENLERVIGRRGQVVDALQHLVGKVVSRGRPGRRGKPVVVDAGGYRARHIERLQQLARRMSDKAMKKRTVVSLNPMTAHDRRIVHMEVVEIPGVVTQSDGSGDQRYVRIIPQEEPEAPRDEAAADREDRGESTPKEG